MPDIELNEAAEEILASLWVAGENTAEKTSLGARPYHADSEEAVKKLQTAGLVVDHSGKLALTPEGEVQAASIIRRERLAERLLTDVLRIGDSLVTETACKFEHLLRRGIDDEICTLLGHPRFCPHGSEIPAGTCCREGMKTAGKVISTLADLNPGQAGVIAYIHSRRQEMLQRLLTLGATPGSPIVLLQNAPSYVFQLGQGEIAVDRETAEEIYVRLSNRRKQSTAGARWLTRPLHRFRRGRPKRSPA